MSAKQNKIHYNPWAEYLYRFPGEHDYRIMYGGRGSSKTFEVTRALILHGHAKPLRIAVAREHKVSITESAQPELIERATDLGLVRPDCYRATRNAIDHENGTHIFFIGLSVVSEEDIKGLSQVDILWIEEAHRMSHSSWEMVYPTIRKEQSEIWLTFNPKYRTDAAWKLAQSSDPSMWIRKVNWRDNYFFTARNERSRLRDKRENPDRYAHIWEGEPDDVSEKRKVLPYALLEACVDAWERRPKPRGAHSVAGLDVSDTGADKNALCHRSGPELYRMDLWRGSESFTTSETARRAAMRAESDGVSRFMYDAGGPGAGVRGPLREKSRPFSITGCQFGGSVQAPDVDFISGRSPKTQKEYFANWASQAGWAVRIRAEKTKRLVAGEEVNPDDCLFINPQIPNLPDILAELAQPEWDDASGKLRIKKQPREPGEAEPPSPDAYDATVLAFSTDARRGIRRPY